ncbi:MAG: isocitrate/isopropylmalate dehydrogenase family protein [Roseomonas sp.]|nr:isocitrate/isopropylmalate dehydrogenase family protein [Roseomonas sp.]
MPSPSNSVRIALLPGDGIGREVTEAATFVLEKLARRHAIGIATETLEAGAFAYQATGTALSDETFDRAKSADAILLGAMGWPGIRYADGTEIAPQLDLRFRLDLYAGVRPIRAIPGVPLPLSDPRAKDIDLVILRESTEGLFYARGRGTVTDDAEARDTMLITRATTERLSRFSFRLAERRAARMGRKQRVTLVDKANVFTSMAFMRKVFLEIAAEFPGVPADAHYVDAMALDLIRKPWEFDVLPTENMFGDILSDLGAGLIGGMGYAPSADIGDTHAVFQPSHGTGPDIAGKGIANPTAAILSAALMLDWLAMRGAGQGFADAATELEAAVDAAFANGLRSAEFGGVGTTAVAQAIAEQIKG